MLRAKRETKRIVLILSMDEYERLQKGFRSTICQYLSEYLRDLLLREPVTVRYRNQSADDFLPIALGLKKELAGIAAEFRVALQKLECGMSPEVLVGLELALQKLDSKADDILILMHKIYTLWLSKSKVSSAFGKS